MSIIDYSYLELGYIRSITTKSNTKYLIINIPGNGKGTNATSYNLQLEEGTVATPYEPYYLLSTTEITQEKDHTLTAIWEKNS